MAGWLSFLPPPQSIKQPSRPASLDSHISSIQTPSYHTSPQLTTTHIEEKNQRDVQTRRSQLMVEQGRSEAVREATSTTIMKKKKQLTATKPDKDKNCSSGSKKQSSHSCTAELAAESPSYRLALKSLFSCRNSHAAQHQHQHPPESTKKCKKQLGCSASICKLKDSSPRVMHRPAAAEVDATAPAGEPCKRRASVSGACNGSSDRLVKKKPLSEVNPKQHGGNGGSSTSSSSSTTGGSSFRAGKGMQLRRLSGCYECHMVVDPISGVFRDGGSMRGATIFSCPDCAEIFVRAETLHLHQSISHAVSELGPEDTSRNIIEIIFQSSWLKKQSPVCVVDRILKVHNAPGTLARFEDYRDAVKAKATSGLAGRRHPRCTADGNELLRFHCATLACSLGLHGATHLCDSSSCAACGVIRDGFKMAAPAAGVRTMATSGRAHDAVEGHEVGERRAMLVCRVIAGRVKRAQEPETETETAPAPEEEYDSVAGSAGVYSSLDELEVFNPRAILPCFVVVYKA